MILVLTVFCLKSVYSKNIDSLLEVSVNTPFDTSKVEVYNDIALYYYRNMLYDKGMLYADSIQIVSDSIGYPLGNIKSLFIRAYLYNRKDYYVKAEFYTEKLLKLARKENNSLYI